jgi:GNAT superfamily N-acetyltransferase
MLRPYDASRASQVARCYNDTVAMLPGAFPAPAAWFTGPAARHSLHYELGKQEMMTAEEGGQVVGFVNVTTAPSPKESWHPKEGTALIRCLTYEPGKRQIGKELLDWAEQWARQRGAQEIIAWHALYNCPCQSPWTHLSNYAGHLRALFGMAGYAPMHDQIYMTWRDFEPPKPVRPDAEFELRTEHQRGLTGPRLKLTAMQGETWLGECQMDRGHASPVLDADRWCYCAGLFIADAFQGKRLGRYLLTTGLQEMRRAGCRHASISTEGGNYRAALFYTNLGYRYLDYSAAWRKDLGGTAAER